jgi:hypothetical protein
MTITTNTFTRFDSESVKEDVADFIALVSPTETPYQSNIRKGKTRNTQFEWQRETLATAVTTNQNLEGDVVGTHTAITPVSRIFSYTEIAWKDFIVSNTSQAVDEYGGAHKKERIAAKLGKEMKRDIESSLLANKGAAAGSTTVARKTAGLPAYLRTNYDTNGGTLPDAYTGAATDTWDNGTQRAFTETILKNVLLQCYNSGANVSTLMLGAFNKQAFSAFSGVVELMKAQGNGQARIIGAASVYVSDFGEISVIPNRFQPARTGFLIDWDMVEMKVLRPYQMQELAKTGDHTRYLMTHEYGQLCKNDEGCGIILDLSTS